MKTKETLIVVGKVIALILLLTLGWVGVVILLPVWVVLLVLDTAMRKFRKAGQRRRNQRRQHCPVHSKPNKEVPNDEVDY